jgi:cytochrome b561
VKGGIVEINPARTNSHLSHDRQSGTQRIQWWDCEKSSSLFPLHGLRIWQTKDSSPPYPKAMPRVGTGHAKYFWVIQYLKMIKLPIEPKHFLKIKNQKDEE